MGLFLVAILFIVISLAFNQWLQAGVGDDSRGDCIENLNQIKRAKTSWALENMKLPTASPDPSDLFGADQFYKILPICPKDGFYTIGLVESLPKCSYSGHRL